MLPFEPLLSSVEAAKLLPFHPVTLLKMARENRVPHFRIGRRVAFRASELNAWLTRYTGEAVRVALPEGEAT